MMAEDRKDAPSPPLPLPGEPPLAERVAEAIRVDQAGEYGAARIYAGQMAVLGHRHRLAPLIRHMAEQEARHLESFDRLMTERGVRPSALQPFWHVAGYALGAATALMGERAAMVCTEAVEQEIDAHYGEQKAELASAEPELAAMIDEFQAEEVAHRDLAIENGARDLPGHDLIAGAIRLGCRVAIALAKKI